jgi:N-acyl-D-amino-acid deacylase
MGLFPLETAVWKMTGLTSADFGLAQRSTLKVGHPADVVVFDAKTIADVATFADPVQPARGIDAVVVNGRLAWFEGRHTGARCGQLIARGGTPTATG